MTKKKIYIYKSIYRGLSQWILFKILMLNSDDFNKDKKLKYYSVNVSIIYF